MKILVTGATGNVGRAVVRELLDMGHEVKGAAINEEDAVRLPACVEPVLFDFTQPGCFMPALAGVERLFLMRPPQITDMSRTLNPFVDAAWQAGVTRIVFLSLLGVEDNPRVPHHAAEAHIKASGIPHTFLRPSFYMQNLSSQHRDEIREEDRIFIPAGRSQSSFIDARDVGAAGANTLVENTPENRAYAFTGAEALTYDEAAYILSDVLGRKITYANPSPLHFLWYSLRKGRPLMMTLVMTMLYHKTRQGLADVCTAVVLLDSFKG